MAAQIMSITSTVIYSVKTNFIFFHTNLTDKQRLHVLDCLKTKQNFKISQKMVKLETLDPTDKLFW